MATQTGTTPRTGALLADRVSTLEASQTLAMAARAKALKAQGKPIIDFTAGEPDCDTPAHIKQAAIQAINEGFTKYTPSSGMPSLREAISGPNDAIETWRCGGKTSAS